MINLPNECFFQIFNNFETYPNNFKTNYRDLFSCLLVNRQWCRTVVPTLWSEPTDYIKDRRLTRIYLLSLNAEERALINPFDIILPKYSRPLFEYSSYTKSVGLKLTDGVKDWLNYEVYDADRSHNSIFMKKKGMDKDIVGAIECSLVAMFLRTSKKLEFLALNVKINKMIFENLYISTSIVYLSSCLYNLDSEDIKLLMKAIGNNKTLTDLYLYDHLCSEGAEALVDALCKNSTLTSLVIYNGQLDFNGVKILADPLCKSINLTSLDINDSDIGSEGGKAFAEVLRKNITLTSLNLSCNQLGSEGGKALAEALCINTTLVSLEIYINQLYSKGAKALADALYKNVTLTSLRWILAIIKLTMKEVKHSQRLFV